MGLAFHMVLSQRYSGSPSGGAAASRDVPSSFDHSAKPLVSRSDQGSAARLPGEVRGTVIERSLADVSGRCDGRSPHQYSAGAGGTPRRTAVIVSSQDRGPASEPRGG